MQSRKRAAAPALTGAGEQAAGVRQLHATAPVAAARVRYEWAVRYRRQWRESAQVRFYQSRPPADRLIAKLLSGGRPDLEPIVELVVQRRVVGEWETVDECGGER
jgi:hypothetical protein